jgi:hypothetical protein
MIRVRLFRSERPAGFVSLDATGHHVRPKGVLPDAAVEKIRKDLALGRIAGQIGLCSWYRQATPFCPMDSAKPCPCDDETCSAATLPWGGI